MDNNEKLLFMDVVRLTNRTDKKLDFFWDAVPYCLQPHGTKGDSVSLPRVIAETILAKFPLKQDPVTGAVVESLLGIEGDERFPTTAYTVDLQEWAEADKSGLPQEVMVGGKLVKKEKVSLTGR